ncbi:MAG TPA: hypothetical protein VLK84_10410 [Longimicrobium sp.]|nr:hypothetical protein [Longimicrobium sp.]
MAEERKPKPVTELDAAALDLSRDDRLSDLEQVEDRLYSDEIDPADIEDHHRIIDEIKAGRMKTVAAEQVLDMLDRMAL